MKVHTPLVALEILEERINQHINLVLEYTPEKGTELYGAFKGLKTALNLIDNLKKEIEVEAPKGEL